ncbi:unnamed protein product [Owenia fusiformis]|uniref:Uncharacterized protein n=1 Tax=Owenia fusiformis TaxID=6347 RepID=A0A8J1TAF7_OWEFU|nr:unnamed protein product [Owenia fusiformis]
MGDWMLNEGPKWAFLFIWFGTNIGVFTGFFLKFYNGAQYYYLNQILGLALPFARGSAACLNLNCMLILFPVCRNLLSFIRGSCNCCRIICRRNVRRQMDKNITFHKALAYMIIFHTAVHIIAHCFNLEFFMQAWDSPNNQTRGLLSTLSTQEDPWLNPIRDPNTNTTVELLKFVPGITGVIITLSLIVIYTSSTEVIRRSYFEVFWFTHHLFAVFFIGLVIHGVQGVVRSQTNIDLHDPVLCATQYLQWGPTNPECPVPQFAGGPAQTWQWVIVPMVFYMIERGIRFYRSQQKIVITKVVKHPSKVLELQMKRKGFKMEAGQYIFLHCPSISRLEWHPFTLTSSPEEDYFSVHIRTVGDWTNALAKMCHADEKEFQEAWKLPAVAADGPFGTASEDVFQYQVDICVAAGIGVTPFASVLKHVWYQYNNPNFETKLRKVHFFWICPDTNAFEWFSDLLHQLETQMAEQGKRDFLDANIYLTRGWDQNQAKNIMLQEEDVYDAVTGLHQKTNYGRPNWDAIFKGIADANPNTSIGVFFCGPKVLSTTLHKMSNKYTNIEEGGAKFFYNKENF